MRARAWLGIALFLIAAPLALLALWLLGLRVPIPAPTPEPPCPPARPMHFSKRSEMLH